MCFLGSLLSVVMARCVIAAQALSNSFRLIPSAPQIRFETTSQDPGNPSPWSCIHLFQLRQGFYRSSRSFPDRSNLGFIRLADSVLFIGKSLGSISSRSFESVLFLRYVHFSLDRNLLGKRFYDCHLFW